MCSQRHGALRAWMTKFWGFGARTATWLGASRNSGYIGALASRKNGRKNHSLKEEWASWALAPWFLLQFRSDHSCAKRQHCWNRSCAKRPIIWPFLREAPHLFDIFARSVPWRNFRKTPVHGAFRARMAAKITHWRRNGHPRRSRRGCSFFVNEWFFRLFLLNIVYMGTILRQISKLWLQKFDKNYQKKIGSDSVCSHHGLVVHFADDSFQDFPFLCKQKGINHAQWHRKSQRIW